MLSYLHFQIENLGLVVGRGSRKQVVVEESEKLVANGDELLLHLQMGTNQKGSAKKTRESFHHKQPMNTPLCGIP